MKVNSFNNMNNISNKTASVGNVSAINKKLLKDEKLIFNNKNDVEELVVSKTSQDNSQYKVGYENPLLKFANDTVYTIVKGYNWIFSSKEDNGIQELDTEEEFDNLSSSLLTFINKSNKKLTIEPSYLKMINREKTSFSDYNTFVDSKKKNDFYKLLTSYWANYFKEKNINIDEKKILYWELDGDNYVIYLDNGSILTLNDDKLNVKDYLSGISYDYSLSDNHYILNSFTLNNGSDALLKFDYSGDKLIIRDLTKEVEADQILFEGENIRNINNIEYYKDDYGNESLYLSNGYLIRLDGDNVKVMDRIDQVTEIAENEVGGTGDKYRNWYYGYDGSGINWCSVFISYIYGHLPGNKLFFSNLNDLGQVTKGQDGAGDVPRKSVDDKHIDPGIYGTWFESEYSDSNTTPQAGDIVLFTWTGDGHYDGHDEYFSDHIGYVYKVDDEKIYTIEGNTGNNDANLSTVQYKEYYRNSGDINGYYRPYYNK